MIDRLRPVRHFLSPRRIAGAQTTESVHALGGQQGGAPREKSGMPHIGAGEQPTPGNVSTVQRTPDRPAGTPDAQAAAPVSTEPNTAEVALFQADAQHAEVAPVATISVLARPGESGRSVPKTKKERRNKSGNKRRRGPVVGAAAAVAAVSVLAACSSGPSFQTNKNTALKSVDCATSILQPYQYPGQQEPAGTQTIWTVTADSQHAVVFRVPNGVEADVIAGGSETTKQASSGSGPATDILLEGPAQVQLPDGGGTVVCFYPQATGRPVKDTVLSAFPQDILLTVG